MKQELFEVNNALYVGMDLYKNMMNSKITINNYEFSETDNKYYCLYLGILYTDNKISRLIKEKTSFKPREYNIKEWESSNYIKLYNTYFADILEDRTFESIQEYYSFLLQSKAIKKYNKFDKIKKQKVYTNA